ncbi:alpha/beta fold hydrolase [Alkalibacillus aidingensis]|uniref:alpha/beta fold hydrolase n=1 Tax=Alkalibacillus aidingensis TaxID=2747607 RepID=UPI001660D6C2|nr:alpha/beta hydrolase [Alkalibacillus aidingensis]
MLLDYKMYKHDSSKEWVVFLHGVGGNYSLFHKQIKKFRKHFNLLFINFPGHGESESLKGKYTFTKIADKVKEILDHLNISKAHLVGISLGTIVMNELSRLAPERISSMTLGGAVIKWQFWTDLLFKLAYMVRYVVPYMFLYTLFALILMPKRNHQHSRNLFVNEAKKIGQKEFINWAGLLIHSDNVYDQLLADKNKKKIPKLYLIGSEDHVFMKGVQYAVKTDPFAEMNVIDNCGHVCNVDQADEFNNLTIQFIHQQLKTDSQDGQIAL